MSLKRYRLRAKHLKHKPKSLWYPIGTVSFLMSSKSARRKLKRIGRTFIEKTHGNRSQFIYIPPPPTREEEYAAHYRCRKCDESNPLSLCSEKPQVMEGIIARTDPLLLMRNNQRLMWKLKCKDFATKP